MLKIDLNCDMGEGMNTDEAIMPYISSANIACGAHAGDEETIKRTIALCLRHKVAIGAHPGFADKKNFGRTAVKLSPQILYDLFSAQVLLVKKIAAQMGAVLHHVKPHGALYNIAAADKIYAQTILKAVKDIDAALIFYGLSNSYMTKEAKALNIKAASEVFADRTYQDNGTLTPRTMSNALITDTSEAVKQAIQLVTENKVTSVTGKTVFVNTDTICLHGDGVHADIFAKIIFENLKQKGISIETI
ncbi:MAG: 5-oxoprolinase subunit PxpA [Agriterribacter sp.]